MAIPEIIKELEPYTGKFPVEALRAAIEDLVDESVADLEGIERDIAAPELSRLEGHTLINDAIGEMEHWGCFRQKDSQPQKLAQLEAPVPSPLPSPSAYIYVAPQPFVREPKIGRNDPCSCGRGKKHKKCCGKG